MARRLWLLLVAPLAGLSLWASCGKVPFTAPAGCNLAVSANPTEIAAQNGQSVITVTVTEKSGTPVADETVITFTTTLGSISPEVKTKNGLATATLSSTGIGGKATVTALSGACGSKTVDVTIGVTSDAIALAATPSTLPPGGGTVSISATVFGSSGQPVPGASVVFSTTQGRLSSAGAPVVTDSSGRATDSLTTDRSADVTATSGTKTKTVTVPVGTTGINTIVLSADQVNLPSSGGSTGLSAVVLGDAGPLPGVPVAWSASAGSLGTSGVTVTDSSGVATNSLSTTITSTVTAAAGSKTTNISITVGAGTATARVSVSASRSSIPASATPPPGPCGSLVAGNVLPIELAALVTDDNGNPIVGREVQFYVDFSELSTCGRSFGAFCGGGTSISASTNASGVATVQYTVTQSDLDTCNCYPSGCRCYPPSTMVICPDPANPTPTPSPTPEPGKGLCPSAALCSNVATCRVTTSGSEDLFCQVAIKAVSGGVSSSNVQFLEYSQ